MSSAWHAGQWFSSWATKHVAYPQYLVDSCSGDTSSSPAMEWDLGKEIAINAYQ